MKIWNNVSLVVYSYTYYTALLNYILFHVISIFLVNFFCWLSWLFPNLLCSDCVIITFTFMISLQLVFCDLFFIVWMLAWIVMDNILYFGCGSMIFSMINDKCFYDEYVSMILFAYTRNDDKCVGWCWDWYHVFNGIVWCCCKRGKSELLLDRHDLTNVVRSTIL